MPVEMLEVEVVKRKSVVNRATSGAGDAKAGSVVAVYLCFEQNWASWQ